MVGLTAVQMIKICCPCRELNHDFSLVQCLRLEITTLTEQFGLYKQISCIALLYVKYFAAAFECQHLVSCPDGSVCVMYVCTEYCMCCGSSSL